MTGKKVAVYVFMSIFLLVSIPAFAKGLITTDVISTEKMTVAWGYCPYGMIETSVMKEKKFYKKYLPNVDVDWFFGLWSSHLINNWIAGKMEVAYLGNMPAIMLQSRVMNTKWVGTALYHTGTNGAIFVPKDSKITSIKQLDGATIATGIGSSHHRILEEVAKQEGIKFKIVSQNPEVAVANLQAGNLDGFCYWPPYIELCKYKDIGKCLPPCNLSKYEPGINQIWPILVSDNFAKKYPKITQGLIFADNDLHHFMVEHPDEAANIIYKALEEKIPLEALKKSLARYHYSDKIGDDEIEIMQRDIDFLYEAKIIRKHFKAKDWADPTFINKYKR